MNISMKYIDEAIIENKRVLLRVDYNVSLNPNHTIANDERIRQSLPTIQHLLKNKNKLILLSHLGQPEKRDKNYSLKPAVTRLHTYLPDHTVILVDSFETASDLFAKQTPKQILVLENLRFYTGEKANDPSFVKSLASLGDVYINDAFSVSHREDASITGLPHVLPSFGGLLLKKEITMLTRITDNPKKPVVAIMGGAKISTKIKLIKKLSQIADHVLVGGGLANNFFTLQGFEIGKSIYEKEALSITGSLLAHTKEHGTNLVLPVDVSVGDKKNHHSPGIIKKVEDVTARDTILDIGVETQALFGNIIATAGTIVWNGPMGYFENPSFAKGTDFIYYSIAENRNAISIVGGGETLAALTNKEHLDRITHISTGGGAMLTYIEHGTLPGIEALKKHD
jgi:phosphoglycerate kinase